MGSLKSDGSRIVQTREATKNIGRAYIFSANGVETEVLIDEAAPTIGTESNPSTAQYSTRSGGRRITTEDEDGVVVSEAVESLPDGEDIDQNPPWVGAGGSIPTFEDVFRAGSNGTLTRGLSDNDTILAAGAPGINVQLNDYSGTASLSVYEGQISLSSQTIQFQASNGIEFNSPVKYFRPYTEVVTLTNLQERTLAETSGSFIVIRGTGTRTIKLPSSPTNGVKYDIKDGDGTASSGNIAINGNGKTIDGSISGVLDTNYESRTVIYNGTQWNNI